MKHRKVIYEYYEVSLGACHRTLGKEIDIFLDGAPNLDDDDDLSAEKFEDNTTVLCDYEGDYEGFEIYSCDITQPLIEFICDRLEISFKDHKNLNFKIVG